MGVVKLSKSEITDYQKYSSMLAGNEAYSPPAYEWITSTTLNSATSSVTFNNLNSYVGVYKHLQLRATARGGSGTSGGYSTRIRFNGATSNYKSHKLGGSTALNSGTNNAFSDGIAVGSYLGNSSVTGAFSAIIIDILDPFSSVKNTTVRGFSGLSDSLNQASSDIALGSGFWINTAPVTSIYLAPDSGTWLAGCRFSLYGLT